VGTNSADGRLSQCRDRGLDALSGEMIDGIDRGRTFLSLDHRLRDNDSSGHYLICGSESWSNLLLHLGGSSSRAVLATIGVPTVFIVDFPIRALSPDCRRELAENLLQVWTYGVARRLRNTPIRDYTFIFHQDLPPSWITGHFHPASIPYPPGLGVGVFQNPFRCCDHCPQDGL
jgi:hypothetical protein